MVTLKDSIQVKVTNDVVVTLSRTKGFLFDETMCQVFSITCLNKEILEQIKDAKMRSFFFSDMQIRHGTFLSAWNY